VGPVNERKALLALVRKLEHEAKDNRDVIFKPWIALRNHVVHYFSAYDDYLKKALSLGGIPNSELLASRLEQPLPVHRDNLGSLIGRIAELGTALEASLDEE
jgi:hypothetical protein